MRGDKGTRLCEGFECCGVCVEFEWGVALERDMLDIGDAARRRRS